MSKCKSFPGMVVSGEVPSSKLIRVWRDYFLRKDPQAANTINAIMDCAVEGVEKARTASDLAGEMMAESLRELADSLDTKQKFKAKP